MKNRAHESAGPHEVPTAVSRGRKAAPAALCLALLLTAGGVTRAQQPHQVQQRPGKAPAAGQNPPPAGTNPARGSGANAAGAHAPAPPAAAPPAQTAQSVVWSLGHPPERLRFPASSEVQFTVSAGDNDVKDVRLAQSTLQDATTFFQLDASQLELCADDGKCDAGMDIPANTTRRLTLKISPTFRTPGIFTGEVSFRVAGKAETQSFKLTVYSRCGWAMVFGGVLIAAGLGSIFW